MFSMKVNCFNCMKLNVVSIIFLILSLFSISCNNENNKERSKFFIQINEKETTYSTGELVFNEEMQQFFDIRITDSVIFLTSQRNNSPITVFSSQNLERLTDLGERGEGPESVDFPLFLKDISRKGNVELFDLNRRCFINIDYNFSQRDYRIKKERMPDSLWASINLNKASDNLYFANGLVPFNKGLYFRWDGRASTKEWTPYYPKTKKKYDNDVTHLYRNSILINKEKGLVVSTLMYFNRIIVFDFNGNILKDIQIGKKLNEPILENPEIAKFSKGTEMFFFNVVGTKNYFYCLWNRNEIGIEVSERKNSKIFVFDWDLNHISTIQVNRPLAGFDVDPYDKYILGLFSNDQEDTSIYKFTLESTKIHNSSLK